MSDDAGLGLPGRIRACLFDLDGVLTDTATVHAAAWKETFDAYLKAHADKNGEPFVAFDETADYDTYVDGKSRADGTRSFLASRHIVLPEGSPDDPAGAGTVIGLGNAKNALVLRKIRDDGVDAYVGSVRYVQAVRAAGLRRAVVSSSANCAAVLDAAGIAALLEARIDGVTVKEDHLAGKPAPDTVLAAARALGVDPELAAVFEDALSGWKPAEREGSVSSLASTGSAKPTRFVPTAPMSWWPTSPSCSARHDPPSGLPRRTVAPAGLRARPESAGS
jgi:beta-phosphoglucomutase family hydrolase